MTTLRPPKQPRSQRTLERIVRAALEILEREGPDALTVQAVVARAGSSVGSFYARFGGKDDLLAYLSERVWKEAAARWSEAVRARSWSDMTLEEIARGAAGLLIEARRSRVRQLRALDHLGRSGDGYARLRDRIVGDVEALLLERRSEIAHAKPELAVRVGLRAVLGVVDWGIEADTDEPLASEELERECTDLLVSYLVGSTKGGETESVEFFDVWG